MADTPDIETNRFTMRKLVRADAAALLPTLALLVSKDLTPAIVFSFSRKECEGAAVAAKGIDEIVSYAHVRARIGEGAEAAGDEQKSSSEAVDDAFLRAD